MRVRNTILSVFLIATLHWVACEARIHHVVLSNDERKIITFERFGFAAGGVLNVSIHDFNFEIEGEKVDDPVYGFLVTKDESVEDFETSIEQGTCLFKPDQAVWSQNYASIKGKWKESGVVLNVYEETKGAYHFYFASCVKSGKVSFVLDASLYNPGPDYLSAGESPVPSILFGFMFVFLACLIKWTKYLKAHREKVNDIHNLMSVLLALKVLSLFTDAGDKHYVKIMGSSNSWNLPYYFFTLLKGIATFTVILLIGAGWSVLKPTLNPRERKVLLVVIVLQVVADIALIVEEELAPGSSGWLQWRDLLHVVDLVCSVSVFFPIMWQISHLRKSTQVDGKAQQNIQALTQFRQFYVSVVAYIYFTRVLVYLLGIVLPSNYSWMMTFSRELATLCFYAMTGYTFRPGADNPYARIRSSSEDDEDYGDDDEEMNEFGLPEPANSAQQRTTSAVDVL